jgi:hypothetical protein
MTLHQAAARNEGVIMSHNQATSAMEIAAKLEPFFDALRGKGPNVQGAVLAQLTARWLAGHVVPGSREETEAARQKIFEMHIAQTWELVSVFER